MLTALFMSSIVLDVLGAAGYGLSNVIGGVVVLFFLEHSAAFRHTKNSCIKQL